jgi:hypothetical protein
LYRKHKAVMLELGMNIIFAGIPDESVSTEVQPIFCLDVISLIGGRRKKTIEVIIRQRRKRYRRNKRY